MEEELIQSAGCIVLKGKKILFGKRFDDEDCYAGVWDLPSCHVESNETAEDAIKREYKEEVNIEIKKLRHLGSFIHFDETSKRRFNHIFFIAEKWEGEPKNMGELERIEWLTIEEAKKLNVTKEDIEFVENALKRI